MPTESSDGDFEPHRDNSAEKVWKTEKYDSSRKRKKSVKKPNESKKMKPSKGNKGITVPKNILVQSCSGCKSILAVPVETVGVIQCGTCRKHQNVAGVAVPDGHFLQICRKCKNILSIPFGSPPEVICASCSEKQLADEPPKPMEK